MIKRDRCVICALYYHILNHVFIRIQSTSIEGLHQYIRSKHLIYHQIIVKRTLFLRDPQRPDSIERIGIDPTIL